MGFEEENYYNSKEFKEILKTYEESVKSGQPAYMDADDLTDIADYYHCNGDDKKAGDAINLALSYNPQAVSPLLYRAREALLTKDFETAREYSNKVLAVDHEEWIFIEGEILICEGKIEEADQFFTQHIESIDNQDDFDNYVYNVACLFSDYSNLGKAVEWTTRYSDESENTDELKELMGHVFFGVGKYSESEKVFNELIDQDPYSNRYWNALANAQFMQEDYNSAISSSEYAIAIDPNDSDSFLSKANSLFYLENYDEAITYYKKYTEKKPKDESGFLYLGTCLVALDRYEEGLAELKKAEKLAAKKRSTSLLPEIYQELAFAYSETHDLETALNYIDKTKDLDCDHVNMKIIKGHMLLANGRMKEAEVVFKDALKVSENSPTTMFRILVSLYDNKYLNACHHLFKLFFDHVEDDWNEGYSYMVACCLDLGKTDEALAYLKLAYEKNPKEVQKILAERFPNEMDPKDYYEYLRNEINKKG